MQSLEDAESKPQADGAAHPRQEGAHACLYKVRFSYNHNLIFILNSFTCLHKVSLCHDHILREDNLDRSQIFCSMLCHAVDA